MSAIKTYAIPTQFAKNAHINAEQYAKLYQQSVENPTTFWSDQAHQFITWFEPSEQNLSSITKDNPFPLGKTATIQGQLNACYNCVDRHLETRADKIALLWEGNTADESRSFTFRELHQHICKFANVLKNHGIQKGDRVCIYLPMIPEAVIAMLACARIGAVHSVVFGGFSPEALKSRILNAGCCLLITADEG